MCKRWHHWLVRWLLCIVCGCWGGGFALAQDAGGPPESAGPTGSPGLVGGPCLANNVCTDGSVCRKLNEQSICLLPPSTGNPTDPQCPSHRKFIQCDPNGNNCRLICYELRGAGCDATMTPQGAGLFALLWLGFVCFFSLQYPVNRRRRRAPWDSN